MDIRGACDGCCFGNQNCSLMLFVNCVFEIGYNLNFPRPLLKLS